ncbi:hypothetical protein [uncultured Bilophila sp.]|uniref:hypothetical protein n=1 Tax=uncultured Bilophila sp. TaxID=529385 RepID=UPI00280AE65F|nr:hypothetical protein [uncultured Bilophila sp.]
MLKLAGMAAVPGVFAPAALPVSVRAEKLNGKDIPVVCFFMPEAGNPHNMASEEGNSIVAAEDLAAAHMDF